MRISHICHECGTELARTAAPPDPIYALPIVVCRCGTAHVRRRNPAILVWRAFTARFRLLLTLATLSLLFFLPIIVIASLAHESLARNAYLIQTQLSDPRNTLSFTQILAAHREALAADNLPPALFSAATIALAAMIGSWLLQHRSLLSRITLVCVIAVLASLPSILDNAYSPGPSSEWILDRPRLNLAIVLCAIWGCGIVAVFATTSAAADFIRTHNPIKPSRKAAFAKARRRRR